jgi:hypothetical protein
VLPAHNVGLTPQQKDIPAVVTELLERDLLSSPNVALLERSRLEYVNREAALSEDRRASLMASAVLVDVDVSRVDPRLRLRASLSDVTGREIGAVEETGVSEKEGATSTCFRIFPLTG